MTAPFIIMLFAHFPNTRIACNFAKLREITQGRQWQTEVDTACIPVAHCVPEQGRHCVVGALLLPRPSVLLPAGLDLNGELWLASEH